MKNRAGFTLIEIVLVLVLIGILLSIVMPNIGYFKTLHEKLEMREFRRDILWARNKAIIESRDYIVHFYHGENYYRIRAGAVISVKKKCFNSGIRLYKGNNLQKLTFKPDGTVSNAGSIRFFDRKDNEFHLSITPVRGLVNIRPYP